MRHRLPVKISKQPAHSFVLRLCLAFFQAIQRIGMDTSFTSNNLQISVCEHGSEFFKFRHFFTPFKIYLRLVLTLYHILS